MSDQPFDIETIRRTTMSKRFLAADRAKLDLAEIGTWDTYLLRESRLLVPIDVQALAVMDGDDEKMVRLPMLIAGPNGQGVSRLEDGMPDPFTEGTPREPGVHLHWAMPDALLRGTLTTCDDGSQNRLSLPVLPDRWVVLRIALPAGSTDVAVTGWVLEADRAIAVPLAQWREGAAVPAGIKPAGEPLTPDQLTGTVGGSVTWSGVYDAVLNRFAFHDPLDDLGSIAPDGVDQDCVSYTVAGWWKDAGEDPLDAARSTDSLHELLDHLRWRLLREWGDAAWGLEQQKAEFELRKALGLTSEERWSSPRPVSIPGQRAAGSAAAPHVSIESTFVEESKIVATSVFAKEAASRYSAPPWQLRSSLLHGSVYGVPVRERVPIDQRPEPSQLAVAIGQHDDDLLAALASPAAAPIDQRRAAERLLAAFTSQKLNAIGSANGLVEVEEHEHSAAFSSVPGGSAGTDRFLQRVQTGGAGGLDLGRDHSVLRVNDTISKKLAEPAPRGRGRSRAPKPIDDTEMLVSWNSRPTLMKASMLEVHDIARSRVGDVLSPSDARVVDRPAPRFTFPDDPMVAIRGAQRSLRHQHDGRGSPDGKLSCRWPTHVITEISGVIAANRFVRSIGNGAVPSEVTTLAREAVLHDPYHDRWIAIAVAPRADRSAVFRRLQAETALRFGTNGVYDGATQVFLPAALKQTRSRRGPAAAARVDSAIRTEQTVIGDTLRKFSLYRGVDPDLVGVTAWSQPWIPMWLEWEIELVGVDPPTIDAWRLGQIDLGHLTADIAGSTVVLRGRAAITTGAATTLSSAVNRFLEAEDALDKIGAGQVDESLETTLRDLSHAVEHIDVITAALDGVRHQLLGLPVSDGLVRANVDGVPGAPAPVQAPAMLVAGTVRLTRARLLDAFGRTLEVPIDAVRVPTRSAVDAAPGVLAVPPRLTRPARWQFRLVAAATPVSESGAEARVDQVDPSLQVNPVAGFVMPDHLDESLEVFGVDGAPLGELLHEAVSGGVTWEIAAGRAGPADAGPHFGLTSAQRSLGDFAAGLVAADAAGRAGAPLDPDGDRESALSALLRAIDTTLWTVDSFAALGGEHIAGLVGRPIAVVRTQLHLELQPPDDLDLTDPERAAEWATATARAAGYAFPVRIGELTRSDDGVLGFFVDDDFSKFRLVDKAIAGAAPESGRSRGQLGLYGDVTKVPSAAAITHHYIAGRDDDDTLMLHLGQRVTLTLFMHPAGKASLTSGVLPRKALALARDWVGPGLSAIAPSLRTGPVLVETDLDTEQQVRLPKVSVFGKDQNFLWRDTPATWRTDAILAATQTALLPDTPAELREGWIRVAPTPPPKSAPTTGQTS